MGTEAPTSEPTPLKAFAKCSVLDCDDKVKTWNLCWLHYSERKARALLSEEEAPAIVTIPKLSAFEEEEYRKSENAPKRVRTCIKCKKQMTERHRLCLKCAPTLPDEPVILY
jgi:hypothetical protein